MEAGTVSTFFGFRVDPIPSYLHSNFPPHRAGRGMDEATEA